MRGQAPGIRAVGEYRICIVGAGPWGTYALERLAATYLARPPARPVAIVVFDRCGSFGDGSTHHHDQAPTSMLNRVASQIAFACDESNATTALLPARLRPTFVEWAAEQFAATGEERFRIAPQDVPPRYLHGEGLLAAFARYVDVLRGVAGVRIELRAEEVTDLSEAGSGRLLVHTDVGSVVPVDRVLLVTGHSDTAPASGSRAAVLARHAAEYPGAVYVDQPYPLRLQLTEDVIPAGISTAVLGMGLTAVDVLLYLTEGRGGCFRPVADGELTYVPSGREPRLVALAPSGVFVASRAVNQKAGDASGREHAGLEHQARFLTLSAIRRLRVEHGRVAQLPGGERLQLDFARQVLPLVVLEMACTYYRVLLGPRFADAAEHSVMPAYQAFLARGGCPPGSPSDGAVDALLEPVEECWSASNAVTTPVQDRRFDWRQFLDPVARFRTSGPVDWRQVVVELMRTDHAASAEGNLNNPAKAACDGVWRDLRSVLSETLDFGGLTAHSHRQMIADHLRCYARMSNGTGLDAMRRILALIESGVLDVSVGPKPVVRPAVEGTGFHVRGSVTGVEIVVVAVVEGRAHRFDAHRDRRPLYPNLLRRGTVRRWRNPGLRDEPDFEPGGLDVTPEFHPRRVDGEPDERITVLGSPVEGVVFFQLAAARPHSSSPLLDNIARWAADVVAPSETAAPVTHPSPVSRSSE